MDIFHEDFSLWAQSKLGSQNRGARKIPIKFIFQRCLCMLIVLETGIPATKSIVKALRTAEPVTLHPVMLNPSYNDPVLLVKNKLIIFVEAQSTWSISILIRILICLAITYQNYITKHGLYVYGSRKIEIPELEFYVIFTGNRKFKKDTISLKEDYCWKCSPHSFRSDCPGTGRCRSAVMQQPVGHADQAPFSFSKVPNNCNNALIFKKTLTKKDLASIITFQRQVQSALPLKTAPSVQGGTEYC